MILDKRSSMFMFMFPLKTSGQGQEDPLELRPHGRSPAGPSESSILQKAGGNGTLMDCYNSYNGYSNIQFDNSSKCLSYTEGVRQ